MAQVETEKLTQILWGAALSRAVCTIAELGIADQIEAGSPQSVESIAGATGTHERSLFEVRRHAKLRAKGCDLQFTGDHRVVGWRRDHLRSSIMSRRRT